MQSPKLKNLAFALCLAFLPSTVFAAGLGKLNVMSGLGEPLKADIELLSVTAEELSTISAAIASTEAYTNQGIDKPASHNDIKIQVTKNARGVPVLKLNSVQPITDAFLDMLIQVDWSSGRLLREYTLLLDPPGYNSESQGSTTQLPSSSTNTQTATPSTSGSTEAVVGGAKAAPSGVSKPKKSNVVKPGVVQAPPTPVQDVANTEYTTERGDTLAKIAQEMKPEGVSLEQMLVGLYQANPKAFDGNNMNRLKVGQIVRAPSAEQLESTTKKAAAKEVRVHSANWNAYKNKLAGIVAESAGTEDAAPTQSSSGKVMAAEDKATPPATGPRDVVKLSATDSAAKNGTGDKALHDKVIALQEESIAKDNALKEAQGRTADLEKQIEDMKKLMALKYDAMAKIQSDAANQPKAEPATPAPADSAPAQAEAPQPLTNPTTNAPAESTPPAQPEAATPATPKPPVAPVVPAPVAETPSFVDGVLQNVDTTTLGFAGGGLALLGAVWLYLRNKRKKNLTSFEEGIMTSGGLKANTVFGNTAGGTVDTGDTSFLTDFSQSTSGGMIDSHDVDPIAEAEVYMAYGRDAQAEEILKDAIVKEPKRYELHLKLLEIYQASGNTSAFETISGELYTTLGATDPVWAKVAQLGIKMDPDNPLYKVEAVEQESADSAAGAAKDDFFASYDSDAVAEDAPELSLPADSLDQDNTTISNVAEQSPFDLDLGALDFDMDSTAKTPTEEESAASEASTDFDLDALNFEASTLEGGKAEDNTAEDSTVTADPFASIAAEAEALPESLALGASSLDDVPEVAEEEETPKSLDVPTIDFPNFSMQAGSEESIELTAKSLPDTDDTQASSLEDFSLEFGEPTEGTVQDDLGMTQAPSFDLTDINLDLTDLSTASAISPVASAGEPEEVETKLDLVMAYLDMEDKIGAKELLEEVMKEGGENQRKRAMELLDKIG